LLGRKMTALGYARTKKGGRAAYVGIALREVRDKPVSATRTPLRLASIRA
jgi:hypothetical protein